MDHLKLSYRRFKLFTAVLDQCEPCFYVMAPMDVVSPISYVYYHKYAYPHNDLTEDGNNTDLRNTGNTAYTYTTLSPTQRIPITKNLISSKSQCYGTFFTGTEAPSVT